VVRQISALQPRDADRWGEVEFVEMQESF